MVRNVERNKILAILKEDGAQLLNYPQYKDDLEMVLTAVKQNGAALEYASRRLKNKLEVVEAAVRQFGPALQHASDETRNCMRVVLAAVEQDDRAFQHASAIRQQDPFIIAARDRTNNYRQALEALTRKINTLNEDSDVYKKTMELRTQVEFLKKTGQESIAILTQVVQDTQALLNKSADMEPAAYLAHAKNMQGKPSLGLKILGGIMIALGAIVAALGAAAALTGIATVPGAAGATAGVAVLAAGIGIFATASKTDGLSKTMSDLAEATIAAQA